MTNGDTNRTPNEIISALVKSSIEQAQNAHRTYVKINERVRPETVDASELEFNERALGLAKYEADGNFKLALQLTDITDEQEAVSLRDAHTKAQSEEMAKRVAELQLLAKGEPEISSTSTEPAIEPVIAKDATAADDTPVAQAAVSSAALAGVMAAAMPTAATDDQPTSVEPVESAIAASHEAVVAPHELVSEASMEAEIEALATKIHDVKNVETDRPEVREFDSEDVELITENSVLEDVPEIEVATPVIEEVSEIEVAAPVVEDVAEIEVAAPVIEDVAEIEVAAPVVEDVAEIEVAAPAVEDVAEIEVAAPAVEDVPEIEVAAPVIEDVPEIEVAAPVIEDVPEIEVAAPVVEEIPEIEIAAPAPAVEEVAEMAPVAMAGATVPGSKEPAIDPQSFDTDLSARLDAVRAMLQGSA